MKAKEAKKGGRYQKVVYLVGEKERGGASAVGKHGHAHIKGGGSIFESLHAIPYFFLKPPILVTWKLRSVRKKVEGAMLTQNRLHANEVCLLPS